MWPKTGMYSAESGKRKAPGSHSVSLVGKSGKTLGD